LRHVRLHCPKKTHLAIVVDQAHNSDARRGFADPRPDRRSITASKADKWERDMRLNLLLAGFIAASLSFEAVTAHAFSFGCGVAVDLDLLLGGNSISCGDATYSNFTNFSSSATGGAVSPNVT